MGWIKEGDVENSAPRWHVLYIHGTFAWRAAWTQAGSALRNEVEQALNPANFVNSEVSWSGLLSFRARDKAAERVRAKMREVEEKNPGIQHVLIGHSHGGNIAMYALSNPALRQATKAVVCLATPFLHFSERWVPGRLAKFFLQTPPLLLVASLLGLATWYVGNLVGIWNPRGEEAMPSEGILTIMVVGILFGWSWTQFARSSDAAVKRWASSLSFPPLRTEQVLIIRHVGDEATGGLAGMSFLNSMISRVLQTAAIVSSFDLWSNLPGRLRYIVPILCGIGAVALIANDPSAGSDIHWTDYFWLVLVFGVFGGYAIAVALVPFYIVPLYLIFAALPLGIASSLLLAFYAPELLLLGMRVEVSAEPTPLGDWKVNLLPPLADDAPITVLLRHSLAYTDPQALQTIGIWLRERVS